MSLFIVGKVYDPCPAQVSNEPFQVTQAILLGIIPGAKPPCSGYRHRPSTP